MTDIQKKFPQATAAATEEDMTLREIAITLFPEHTKSTTDENHYIFTMYADTPAKHVFKCSCGKQLEILRVTCMVSPEKLRALNAAKKTLRTVF